MQGDTLQRSGSSLHNAAMGTDQEQADAYFSELLSYSLSRLNKEPEMLAADQEQLKQRMQGSVVEHYPAFLQVSDTLRSVCGEVEAISSHLHSLVQHMPQLGEGCKEFTRTADTILGQQASNKTLLAHHATLLELLEVPQLMETCVRNGHYDEALDLQALATKLCLTAGDTGVVALLREQVATISAAMADSLLGKLRGSITLMECLRTMGLLRRMGVATEPQLRMSFLRCREEWLAQQVAELDDSVPYEYLKRLTDVYRLHLFDIVMQYRAVFSEEAAPQGGHSAGSGGSGAGGGEAAGAALHHWAEFRVSAFLRAVERYVPRLMEGAAIASVLDHTMYCGTSLGRVGLDFRPLLSDVFEQRVGELTKANLATAVETFSGVLATHKWVSIPGLNRGSRSASSKPAAAGTASGVEPPYDLMEHIPLAVLINLLLSALNELRHCAPMALAQPVCSWMQEALQRCASCLALHPTAKSLSGSEQRLYQAACRSFASQLVPFAVSCVGKVYAAAGKHIRLEVIKEPLAAALGTGGLAAVRPAAVASPRAGAGRRPGAGLEATGSPRAGSPTATQAPKSPSSPPPRSPATTPRAAGSQPTSPLKAGGTGAVAATASEE